MLRPLLAAGAIVALAVPALAQAQGPTPADPAVREMRRERANPAVPAVPAQNRNAAEADAAGVTNARGLLSEARALLARRRAGAAIEALERVETRLLTNSVPATEAGQPQTTAALSQIASARRLAAQGDFASARQALDRAEAALPASPTGPGAQPLPDTVPTAVDAPQPRGARPAPRPATPPAPGGTPAERMPPRG